MEGFRQAVLPTHGRGKPGALLAASGRQTRPANRSPHPLGEGELGDHRKAPCCGRVGPVCRFRGGGGAEWPCRGYLDGVGTHVGRRLSGPSEFRERTPPGSPVSRPLGAFDFHTRIISAALGTFPGSTSKILIHSSSTKKIAHRRSRTGGLHGYNLYLILPGGRICLNGVVAILNEMRR